MARGQGPTDFMEGYQTVIDHEHAHVHENEAFFASISGDLTASQVVNVLVVTPDNAQWANMALGLQSALKVVFSIYEADASVYVTANDIAAFNRNRNSAHESNLLLCSAPTGGTTGNPLTTLTLGGSSANGRASAVGAMDTRTEIILKQNTTYLFRITSAAASNTYAFVLDWYEHEFNLWADRTGL